MAEQTHRIERDSMGEVKVPADALYGAQTQRAVDNFPISDLRFPRTFVRALGLIKGAAAAANDELGLMDPTMAAGNSKGGARGGRWHARRPFRARHLPDRLGHQHQYERQRGAGKPGDQVPGQQGAPERPHQHEPELQRRDPHGDPRERLPGDRREPAARPAPSARDAGRQGRRSRSCRHHRPHPPDGRHAGAHEPDLGGWASQIAHGIDRIEASLPRLAELAQGGTAVGTGINAHPEFGQRYRRPAGRDDGPALCDEPQLL